MATTDVIEGLSDHERALLSLALVLFILEANIGLVSGPFDAQMLEREMPVALNLFNRIAGAFGDGMRLDGDLVALFNATLSQHAAAEREGKS